MRVVLAGPDEDGLADALADRDVRVGRVQGVATGDTMAEAGIDGADVLVLTAVEDASAIPVAKDRNPDVRVVVYARASLPEFATAQTDLALDPALFDPTVVAEELATDGTGPDAGV